MEESDQMRAAIESHPRGFTIRFEVVPGSSNLKVPSGFNPWRKSLEAKLTEKPTKGKANQQLIRELSNILKISKDSIMVMSGQKSSRKVILVEGLDVQTAIKRLLEAKDEV